MSNRICLLSDASVLHCRRWATALADRGHDVHLVTPENWSLEEVTVHEQQLYPHGASFLGRLWKGFQNVLRVRSIVFELEPDVVHLMGLFTVMGPDLKFTVSGLEPLVVSPWGTDVVYTGEEEESRASQHQKSYLLGQADELTATSPYLADQMQNYLQENRDIHIVPYGVDCGRFSPPDSRSESPPVKLLFHKKYERVYGPDLLLRALARVRERRLDIVLTMIGKGEKRADLENQAAELDVDDAVSFEGYVSNDRLPSYLHDAHISVMPSRYESFGVAAVEALATETPVIATDVGGVSEVVRDGETGLLVPPEDEDVLADAIEELADNANLRRKMGTQGREHVRSNFQWADCVTKMEQVYERVVE